VTVSDALFDRMHASTDGWSQVAVAEARSKAARALEEVDPAAARIAWSFAAHAYAVYYEQYQAHLPASRWDYDIARELHEAESNFCRAGESRSARFPSQ